MSRSSNPRRNARSTRGLADLALALERLELQRWLVRDWAFILETLAGDTTEARAYPRSEACFEGAPLCLSPRYAKGRGLGGP